MTKAQFLASLAAAYRVANASDTEHRADWTKPTMASATCRHLDALVHDLLAQGVVTAEEHRAFWNTL